METLEDELARFQQGLKYWEETLEVIAPLPDYEVLYDLWGGRAIVDIKASRESINRNIVYCKNEIAKLETQLKLEPPLL